MELLQSLICWQGNDNRKRFTLINLLSYLVFILVSVIFSKMKITLFIIFIVLISFTLFTTKRRLNDANLKKNWLVVPALCFFITGSIIILTTSGVFYWLLVLPVIVSFLLLTYPSHKNKSYILGYHGPVNLSAYAHTVSQVKHNKRIEPSLFNSQTEDSIAPQYSDEQTNGFNEENTDQDIGELIRFYLLSHKNAIFSLGIILSVVITGIMISLLINNKNSNHVETPSNVVQKSPSIEPIAKQHPIVLPDNFSLMLSAHNGLIIHWNSQSELNNKIQWSQLSGEGDDECMQVTFNKGQSTRTLKVILENDLEYYAYFSPLDSAQLIKNIAYQSNFSLCGYTFSLKGSQAVIGKSDVYGEYLTH